MHVSDDELDSWSALQEIERSRLIFYFFFLDQKWPDFNRQNWEKA